MSVPASGGVPTGGAGEEEFDLPPNPDAAFASLMDALAPEPDASEAGAAAGEAGADPGADPGRAPGAAGTPDAAGDGQAGRQAAADQRPTAGDPDGAGADRAADGGAEGPDAGDPEQPAATAGAGDRVPADWTASAADLAPKLGELSTKIEERTTQAYQAEALEAVREEHSPYFDALKKHPRLLVGQEVPAIGREGTERLKDTNDAREWQEAVKSILADEVRDRASRKLEESGDFLETIHASIDLFKNNVDLIPGTKDFDTELANRFAELVEPYELRSEGKLQGYSVPVQPLIDRLRTQLKTERAAKPAAGAQPSTGKTASAPAARKPADPPQAGIPSKAGNSGEKEDFSTLFGTIGLPNLQI